jgi:hypothetical protein
MEAVQRDMVNPSRDDESGQYTTVYEDADFIGAIRDRGGAASTRQIADAVGCDKDTAYRRLRTLRDDQGVLDSEDIGNTMLWSLEGGETDG